MIARILMILLVIAAIRVPVEAGIMENLSNYFSKTAPSKDSIVKLLIVHDKPGVILEVKGKYKIYDPHTNSFISTRFIGKRKYVQALKEGISWGEEFPGVFQLLIIPDHPSTTTLVDGIEYKGLVYIYDIGGTISVVNELNYDDYLSLVLPSQIPANLPEEALAAAAIAARTNAYFRKQNAKSKFWDIEANQVGYQGHALAQSSPEIKKALEATKSMVMSHDGPSAPIKAFPAMWDATADKKAVVAKISFAEAAEMAKSGEHAAVILKKAFPGAIIQRIE